MINVSKIINAVKRADIDFPCGKGYVLWDSHHDDYLCMRLGPDEDDLTNMIWNILVWVKTPVEDRFSRAILADWEIDHIQEIIADNIDDEETRMVYEPLMKQIHGEIREMGDVLRIVPCVLYANDKIELDFIHVISFKFGGLPNER